MKTKKFDCVEMKRKGAELVHDKIAHLTREEQLQYWRSGNDALRQIMDATKQKSKKVA